MKMPRKKSAQGTTRDSASQTSSAAIKRCAHETSDGRRCRLPRYNDHPALCLFHAREELQLLESQRLGAELAASVTGQFLTATDINFVLGKLFTALAQNRIPPRNAATLAYIAQLMLHSLHNVKREYPFHYKSGDWNRMLDEAITLSDSTPDPASEDSSDDPATDLSDDILASSSNSTADNSSDVALSDPEQS